MFEIIEKPLSLERVFPSIDLAYNIALGSYDVLVKRLDLMDSRLQTMIALYASVTAAIPAIGANRGLIFRSNWFYAAIIAMAIATILTAIARLTGTVRILDPNKLNDDYWLKRPECEFKSLIIDSASLAFKANNSLLFRKWLLTIIVTIIFSLGAGCMAAWVATGRHP
jgi:hypothetical protein